MRVFLGGTCNGTQWRDRLVPLLKCDWFNPVVPNWTQECYEEELRQREECDYVLYVITPLMTGVYSIAEAVDDSNKRPERTIFCYLETDYVKVDGALYDERSNTATSFTKAQLKSLDATRKMIQENGGIICETLEDVAYFLNLGYNE